MGFIRTSLLVSAAALVFVLVGCGDSSSSTGLSDKTKPGEANYVPGDSKGAAYVRNRRCGSCHTEDESKPLAGTNHKLTGLADQFALYPPNLTPDKTTGIGNWTDAQLTEAIRNGVDDKGTYLCPQMKHFGDMSDEEVTAIIGYLRGLPPVNHVVSHSICPPLK